MQQALRNGRDRGPLRVEGGEVGILGWIIPGLIAGGVYKAIFAGDDPGGIIVALIVGVVGAILGGFVAQMLFNRDALDNFFDLVTWLGAIVGAVILLVIYDLFALRGYGRRRVI
jgi:uncharacterized membrane protein YeaQ/YmgE (transglycosylase-associated protein family)